MTKKYEIVLKYIKDISVEIPSAEVFVFSREHITKYSLGINISSKALKNEMVEGYNEQSPFNVIIIEGAIQEVPLNIIDQLEEEGRLFAIVQEGEICSAKLFKKNGRSISEQKLFNCTMPVLSMFMKKNSFSF